MEFWVFGFYVKSMIKFLKVAGYLLFISILLITGCDTQSPIEISGLTTENVENPAVVDVSQLRLSWINEITPGVRGQQQTAYQIRVASRFGLLESPDLWDSQKVPGSSSNRIEYEGKKLESGQDCWWQVRIWDENDAVSEWSEPAKWGMALLEASDWQARWIGAPWQGEEPLPDLKWPGAELEELPPAAPHLRKTFRITKEVRKAKAYVTGLGYFEFYLNGQKVGIDVLVPNQTNYSAREGLMEKNIPLPDDFAGYKVMYLGYDVTSLVQTGENAVGAVLGNGFYNPSKYWAAGYGSPRFIGQLHLTYDDGTTEVIVSDESWKASKGPILMDMVYYGEVYDARKELDEWSQPGFDDSNWENVVLREPPTGELVAHTPYTDIISRQIPPKTIEKLDNGNYFVDFGEEVSGWIRLVDVEGPAGHQVDIAFNSNLYSGDNTYIFRGDGEENYAPRFNWFVFSGVEIKNWPGELKKENLLAEVVHTQVDTAAIFETSNKMLNELVEAWQRSQLDNTHGGIASDCPHRERSPYTGDGQVAVEMVLNNFDARSFYDKWIQDMIEAQVVETGYVPNCAPWQPGCGGGVAWGAAICIMPWEYYRYYGTIDMLENTYFPMKEYVRYMQKWVDEDGIMFSQRQGKDGEVLQWFNLGDWACVDDQCPPDDLVHTFYFWRCVDIVAKTAAVLGEEQESTQYQQLADRTRRAFQDRFYDPNRATYGAYGSNVFALVMGATEGIEDQVVNALKTNLDSADQHLHTGIFGTQFLFETLSDNGMHELAYTVINQRDWPSFGAWLEDGATTTREHWDEGGSHNHPMFGGGLTWLYKKLAGMNIVENSPGFEKIIFQPQPVEDISYVKYELNTVRGKAGIHWEKADEFYMKVTVPVGSTAEVRVPGSPGRVTESGKSVTETVGVDFIQESGNYSVYEVSSGVYEFRVME